MSLSAFLSQEQIMRKLSRNCLETFSEEKKNKLHFVLNWLTNYTIALASDERPDKVQHTCERFLIPRKSNSALFRHLVELSVGVIRY